MDSNAHENGRRRRRRIGLLQQRVQRFEPQKHQHQHPLLATCGRRRLPQKWREKRALGVSQNAKSHFERFLVKSVQ